MDKWIDSKIRLPIGENKHKQHLVLTPNGIDIAYVDDKKNWIKSRGIGVEQSLSVSFWNELPNIK